jgi:uncharacterized protein YcaQ
MCPPDTRQPPAEPVSPELVHAHKSASPQNAAAYAESPRITSILAGNGQAPPSAERPHSLVLMSARRTALSRAQARRIALAAQLLDVGQRPVSAGTIRRLVGDLGAIQLDSVNVLVRSHFLPVFSRFGAYDRALLERAAYARPRRIFEYWGHEASLMPMESFPLMRWRMERAKSGEGTWKHVAQVGREEKDLVARVKQTIVERGPMTASDFEQQPGAKRGESWWGWTQTKRALEFLFWAGELSASTRRPSFERVYDLTERVVPPEVLQKRIGTEAACAELMEIAARACGVATQSDLRDYFRLPLTYARKAVRQLVERGRLLEVKIEGWKQPAYLHADARVPRAIDTSALLSPFDSLVWNRERTNRLFDFHYRIEIYTPVHKRVHGYYVLPYLLGDSLVARVDLKADRAASTLLVHAIHYEPGVSRREVRARLNADLRAMADWLGMERVRAPR